MDLDLESFLESVIYAKNGKSKRNIPETEKTDQKVKELNPHWQNDGRGLPPVDGSNKRTTKSGDGGLSWLKKSLQRSKETAAREGRSLEEVVSERHGSLESLYKQISEAEEYVASKGESLASNNKTDQKVKELNPHWQNDGRGLPPVDGSNKRTTKSGDGGLSWLKKSLQRSKETAAREGRSLEEVVSERHGSLESLYKQISEAEEYVASKGESLASNNRGRDFRKGRSRNFEHSDSRRRYNHDDKNPFTDDRQIYDKDVKNDNNDRYENRRKADDKDNYSQNVNKIYQTKKEFSKEVPQQSNHRKEASHNYPAKNVKANIPQKPNRQTEEEPVKTVPNVLSAEERNKISAKMLKAEMMGDNELVKQLKAMLDGSTQSNVVENNKRSAPKENEEILVFQNRKGTTIPFRRGDFPEENSSGRKRQKLETHQDGLRTKYFHDDDQTTIQSLFKEEKLARGNREIDDFIRMAGRVNRTLQDSETIDDEMLRNYKPVNTFSTKKQMAMIEQKIMCTKTVKCEFCPQNLQKHLIVSMGEMAMLCVPAHKSMVPGHCLIVPVDHVVQSTACDEDVLEEMKMYKKSLVKMFAEQRKSVVFMETSKNLKSYPHLVIECIPIPTEEADDIDICFQTSMSEWGSEWSQNKKLIKIKGGVKRSIPAGLPYFHVGVDVEDGYGHHIEDEEKFPWFFGRQIIGSRLDFDSTLWRHPRFDNFEEQRSKVVELTKRFKRFDPIRH